MIKLLINRMYYTKFWKSKTSETNKFSDNYKEFKSIIRGQLDEYSKLIMIT